LGSVTQLICGWVSKIVIQRSLTLDFVVAEKSGQSMVMRAFTRHQSCWLLLVLLTSVTLESAGEALAPAPSWAELLDRAKSNRHLDPARQDLVEYARTVLATPIVRRAKKIGDIDQQRRPLDSRVQNLEAKNRETFALAMNSCQTAYAMEGQLPLLAAAYRLTGDIAFRDRVAAQLEEMSTWSPIQLPGWTLHSPGKRLPPDGNDGAWLATGNGLRGIYFCLRLMPEGSLDQALIAKVHALVEKEIAGIVDDWKTKRTWFARSHNPISNQWMLPTEGLIEACLLLGLDKYRDAYEFGVTNFLEALNAHGPNGEFEEGFAYASMTLKSMFHAAQAMAAAGDRRAIDHPYLRKFPAWYIHNLQPGDTAINCFDGAHAFGATKRMVSLLSLMVVCVNSPEAIWALRNLTDGPSDNLPGLLARTRLRTEKGEAPALFAYYERATRVNWRSRWRDDAVGVWVRGGHKLDQHDHQDRRHVNLIWHGRPILIEADTCAYGHPLINVDYKSGVGHNVLQLGTNYPADPMHAGKDCPLPGWQKRGAIAPITVQQLDAKGGDVTVSCQSGYANLARWDRRVQWRTDWLAVNDNVALVDGKTDFILFRWHLGTTYPVKIAERKNRWEVAWPAAKLTLKADAPIAAKQVRLPDHTLEGHSGSENSDNTHTCIVVQTREPRATLMLDTEVRPRFVAIGERHGNHLD